MSIEACQKGGSVQDPFGKIMAPWTFSVKFPYDTQFTISSLMFVTGEDRNLKLLTRGPAPKQFTPIYGQALYLMANSSTLGEACVGLNLYAGPFHLTAKTSQELQIETSIFQPSAGTSSSSASGASPNRDSANDYPKIGVSAC
jgi:hypothetical protein